MNKFAALAGLALLCTTAISAEARDRWRYRDFAPWHNDEVIYLDDEEETVWYDEDDDVVIVRPRERLRRQLQREQALENHDTEDLWWVEDGARQKLEQRAKPRKPQAKKQAVKKAPVAKPAVAAAVAPTPKVKPSIIGSAAAATPAKPIITAKTNPPTNDVSKKSDADAMVTASLSKPKLDEKPKAKPVIAKPVSGKTIGCSAGAAVIVGYGFADVKPKACTGDSYAYTALRAGKTYEIKLTAASGEITDVKKVN